MSEPTKILVIQPGLIGDCILTLPLIGALRELHQTDSVELWAHREYAGYLAGRSDVLTTRDILEVNIAPLFGKVPNVKYAHHAQLIATLKEFDLVVAFVHKRHNAQEACLRRIAEESHGQLIACMIFMPEMQTGLHITAYHNQQYNQQIHNSHCLKDVNLEATFIAPNDEDKMAAVEMLARAGIRKDRPIAAIHPGAGVAWKKWHASNFRRLAASLTARGLQVLWIHGPADFGDIGITAIHDPRENRNGIVNQPLRALAGLFSFLDLYIGNDSGITHLAAAAGCPTVSIFGPTDHVLYKPIGPHVAAFRPSPESFTTESELDLCKLISTYQKLKRSAGTSAEPVTPGPSSMPGDVPSSPVTKNHNMTIPASSAD